MMCRSCAGTGRMPGMPYLRCLTCFGAGRVPKPAVSGCTLEA